MTELKLTPEDFTGLVNTMQWMSENANKDGYVLATVSTVYWSLRQKHSTIESRLNTPHNFTRLYLAALEEMGCIKIDSMLNHGKRAYDSPDYDMPAPIALVRVMKELTQEVWDEFYTQHADPLVVEQARSAALQAEVERLRAQVERLQGGPQQ